MDDKSLDVKNEEDTRAKVSDVQIHGNVDAFALLCKASSESQGWMKSTKVANVEGGCIVQVTTQQKNPDGSYAVAEALTYVPGVNIDKECNPPVLNRIREYGMLTPYADTPEDIARREENEKNYNRREYLGVLLELQKSGHNVHDEINESLKTLKESYGI